MKKYVLGVVFTMLSLFNPLNAQLVYQEEPEDFKPKVEVATCFIRANNEILFLKRLPFKPQGNTWGTPGGKFDEGENATQAVVRETREETGIKLNPESMTYHGKVYIRYPDGDYTLHLFEYQADNWLDVKINPGEHADYRWITMDEALSMPLIPGQDECLALVYNPSSASTMG